MKSIILKRSVLMAFINTIIFSFLAIDFSAEYETFFSIISQVFVLFLFSLLMLLFFIPVWYKLKQGNVPTIFEYGTPFYGCLAWGFMATANFRNIATMANLIEIPIVFFISVASAWLEGILNKNKSKTILVLSMIIPVITAILLRAFMPTLSE